MSATVSPLLLARRTSRLAESAIGSVLRLADSADLIALSAGNPAPETFAIAEVTEVVTGLLSAGPLVFQYGDTEGLWSLREWIASRESALLARPVDPAATVLTHGSQQALDLVCKALLDPGDVVIVDRPSYVGALQVFNSFQARVVSVPIAADQDLAALASALSRGPRAKFLYLVPNFANPTGLSLTMRQRETLAALAGRHGFAIVEDDPYGELWFDESGPRPTALAALSDQVIRLGSFSKVLFPAARLGYLTAPRQLTGTLQKYKQAADLGNSLFLQRIVDELVRRPGFLAGRLAISRMLYRRRRDALARSLREHVGERLLFDTPDGGFFVWARLAAGTSADRLLAEALEERVSFVPGRAFFADAPDPATLRLSFSCATTEQLAAAGGRLAAALDRVPR